MYKGDSASWKRVTKKNPHDVIANETGSIDTWQNTGRVCLDSIDACRTDLAEPGVEIPGINKAGKTVVAWVPGVDTCRLSFCNRNLPSFRLLPHWCSQYGNLQLDPTLRKFSSNRNLQLSPAVFWCLPTLVFNRRKSK